jgi:peptidoglycan hydrolase-like protein with peptidoglycan-binding domain
VAFNPLNVVLSHAGNTGKFSRSMLAFSSMKRANTWAGFLLFGVWLTTSAIADPGRAFHGIAVAGALVRAGTAFRNTALVRDATISRQTAGLGRTALVRDATGRFGAWGGVPMRRVDGAKFGRYAYRSRYDYGNHRDRFDRRRDGYADGAGYYGYADPYGYGYADNYLYPGNYDSYTYAPGDDDQAADAAPPVATGVGLVAAVQTKLTRQAYYDGPLDGVINEETRRAIREYQEDHGLPVTGLINPDLLSSMAIRYISPLT